MKIIQNMAAGISLFLLWGTSLGAQDFRMTTPIPRSIVAPDRSETRFGTLKFFDGFPDVETVEKVYDNLDFQRAVQAYLMALPAVSQAGMRAGLRQFGPDNQTVVMWETLMDSRTLALSADDNSVYNFVWLDLSRGPLVIEAPAGVFGLIDDFWSRPVVDVGLADQDGGHGGKYLLLPPDYEGLVPSGYVVVRPRTFGNWFASRSFLVNGDPRPGVELVKKKLRIYALADATTPRL
jgi:hypothetical protein